MNAVTELLREAAQLGIRLKRDGDYIVAEGVLTDAFLAQLRRHKPDLLRALDDTEAEDLREAFEERAGILEHDGGLSRVQAEAEAARMVATLARNRGYTCGPARSPARPSGAVGELPDCPGPVDSLPLGTAKFAVLPSRRVIRQGAAQEAAWAMISTDPATSAYSDLTEIKQDSNKSNEEQCPGELSR